MGQQNETESLFGGDSEMSRLMRAHDWGATPLGPVKSWPQALKIVVRILLDSRYAMWLGWGPEFTFFYNDAYARMSLGAKHPWALGRPAREVWAEIWGEIGPRAESVVRTGKATWDERLLLFLVRQGFTEESYHTFSYSPVPGDGGGVGGILCVVTEDTERVIGERRLRTLRELAAASIEQAKSTEQACATAIRTLAANPFDLPFALLYLIDPDGRSARLIDAAGLRPEASARHAVVSLTGPDELEPEWPLRTVLSAGQAQLVQHCEQLLGEGPVGVFPELPHTAVVLPVRKSGQEGLAGFLVGGVSPRRQFDDEYRGFYELVAGQIATSVANARAYEEERRRAEALAELDRAKTAFFSNISHEFRTPLTLMLGPVEDILSEDGKLPSAYRERLEITHRNGRRLQRLVNTLLDFSRIEAGRFRASFEPTDLSALTVDLASNFRSACEKAGLRLVVDCPPLSEAVFVDRQMWEKIVLNLLSNAFKFTFVGEIAVSLHRICHSVELRVRDTGSGIPASEIPRLFERFHRIENTRSRTHEGSGIGLALVHELVKLHGGAISAESELGRGTMFRVSIPLGAAHLPQEQIGHRDETASSVIGASPFVEEALRWLPDAGDANNETDLELVVGVGEGDSPSSSTPSPLPPSQRPRILVADDNADMRRYITRLLADQYEVEAVPDGAAALAAAGRQLPDLILSDVMMPRLDGFGLLREFRSNPDAAGTPFILLSARAGEESRVEGMVAGADDYLVKPFSARELLARIGAALKIARIRREALDRERRLLAEVEELNRNLQRRITEFQILIDVIPIGIATTDDPSCQRIWSNRAMARMLRVAPETTNISLSAPAEERPSYKVFENGRELSPDELPLQSAVLKRQEVRGVKQDILRKDGTWLSLLNYAVPLFDEAGRPRGGIYCGVDITEQEQTQQALREAERRFRAVFNQQFQFMATLAPDGTVLEANDTCFRTTGVDREQVVGRLIWDTPWWNTLPTMQDWLRRSVAEAVRHDGPITGETDYTVAGGAVRHSTVVLTALKDEVGQTSLLILEGRDDTDRKRAEAALRRSEERWRTMAEALPNLLWTDLPNGQCDWLSSQWGKYTGIPENELLGLNWVEKVLHPDDRDRTVAAWQAACADLADYDVEYRIRRHDGEYHWFKTRGVPIRDEAGKIVYWFGTCTDIQDIKQAEQQLAEVHEVLREADRRKDEFLATLAHELRNPLAPIRNGLQVLRLAGNDRIAMEQARTMMERQLAHMVHLVDDLLDLSRISRGKITLRKERMELAKVVQQAVETSRPAIEQAGHELTVALPPGPIFVDADATRLAQVFSNLLNNAAKYTEHGGRIWLTVRRQGAEAIVAVRDTGVGIPAHMLAKVFEMFTQVDRNLERAQGGIGIGLSIVKRLVEMHNGSVEAFSGGHGMGSEFVVRLPVVLSILPDSGSREHEPIGPSKRRILVVDDNRDAAVSLAMMLNLMGNETQTAHDGVEALELIPVFGPQVVLLDIGMPRLNGYDTARRIRAEAWGASIILIALTGWGQEEDRRRSHEVGFDQHLVKPVEPAALEKLLAKLQVETA
jgi:PAS domain S-box-containing protein